MKHLRKASIEFIEENKDLLKEIAKYGTKPYSIMAETLILEYKREKRRKH